MRKLITVLAGSLLTALALTACGAGGQAGTPDGSAPAESTSAGTSGELTTVVVGASPVPQAKILEFVQDKLATEAGIKLEIREFDDYVLPNEALAAGELDANYFQHLPYLEDQIKEKGYQFSHGEGIHIEPYALFSKKFKSASEVPDGAVVALTNDPSNQYRGLKLLETVGLLKDVNPGDSVLTLTDAQNPKHLKFEENQPEVIVQQLDDPKVDVALINGNFILTAGLNTDDAIAAETVKGNPYANILVWRTDNANPGVAILDKLLHSQEVADFIKQTWPSGSVVPGTEG